MTEFEWLRQMRELRQPLTPQRDLWAAIDAALDDAGRSESSAAQALQPRRRWLLAASLAASMVLVGSLAWRAWQPMPSGTPVADAASAAPPPWKPADPRLSGAAIELDAARMELQLAIRQAPDSPALQRLIERTELQQAQLRQLAHQAS